MNTPSGNAEFDLNSIRNNVVASLGGNENCFGNDNELIDQPLNGNAACDNGSYKETQDVLNSLESEIQSVALNEAKKIRESAIGTLNPVFKPIVNDWSMWTSGTLTAGKNIETSTASKQQIISQSLHLGFDRPTDRPTDDRDGVVGFALGIGYDKTDVGEDISNVKSTNYSLSAYGEIYPQEDNTLEGVVGLGHLKFRTARLDKDGLDTLTGKRDANQLFGSLKWKGKYDGTVKYEGTANEDEWTVHPYGKIEASRTKFDKFSESGSVNALTFENQYLTNVRGSIGVDAHYLHKIDDKTVSPFLNLEYGEKLFNSSAPVLYASQADNKVEPTIYSITIDNTSKDDIRFGLGVGINTDDDFNAVVGYKRTQQIEDDLGLGKNYTDQVYLELEWEFASCYGWLYKDTACFIEPHATTDSTPNVFDVGGKAVTFDNQSYGHIELLLDRGIANILSNAATQK
jgi:outer membrane autotransporter protein